MRILAITSLLLFVAATTNPIDHYEQAFSKLGEGIDEDAPLDATVAKHLKENQGVIQSLREAAKLPAARWPDDGDVAKNLPSLNKPREAASLLLLSARMELKDGKPVDAVDDCLAAMALARNVGQQKLLIARLVEAGIEDMAITQMQAMLPSLPDEVVKTLPARLAALPKPVTAAQTVDAEFEYARREVNVQRDGLPAVLEAAAPFYKAVAAATTQPAEQFEATVDAEAAKLFLNPYVKTVAPSLKPALRSLRKFEVRRQWLFDACTTAAAGVSKRG